MAHQSAAAAASRRTEFASSASAAWALSGAILAAALQQHVEGVHHALAQVAGAARRQQGAELEGFGHPLLVDVRQHVVLSLAAEDDLGVVVVEVDLWEGKNTMMLADEFRFLRFRTGGGRVLSSAPVCFCSVFTWKVPSLKSIMRARSDLSHCSR